MRERTLADRLLRWFARHRRDLPWRREPRDPYRVWLAEVMLQQTQVTTVVPYYERWLERFPTLEALAAAPLDAVLKLWEGLGYYARARNLHAAACAVVQTHGGRIPATVEGLLRLPGVGRYTAGAIASLAFNADAPALDGNVKRVLSRVHGLSAPKEDELWRLAESLLPPGRAGAFNEALMDLGATVCTPRAPQCPACPLRTLCVAQASGDPEAYPARLRKKSTPHHQVITAVIVDEGGRVLMGQRPPDGLLGGLWEFVSSELRTSSNSNGEDAFGSGSSAPLKRMIVTRTGLHIGRADIAPLGEVKHAFTHFRITRRAWLVRLATRCHATLQPKGYGRLLWASPAEVESLALTRSDQKIWQMYRNTTTGS
ncbi:MAG: A/G-specific adenine glycosylase [Anaerolineae bacterium]|nr:A/G-specific adenine glycosylase [Anaerolineae bacterium]